MINFHFTRLFRFSLRTLFAVVTVFAVYLWLFAPRPPTKFYTLDLRLPEGVSLSSGTPIFKSGIRIGTIGQRIRTDDQTAIPTASIRTDVQVYRFDVASVVTASSTNDAEVRIEPRSDKLVRGIATLSDGDILDAFVAEEAK